MSLPRGIKKNVSSCLMHVGGAVASSAARLRKPAGAPRIRALISIFDAITAFFRAELPIKLARALSRVGWSALFAGSTLANAGAYLRPRRIESRPEHYR